MPGSSLNRLVLTLCLAALSWESRAAQQTNDLSGTTDESIRHVVELVAHRQVTPVLDGDYSRVTTIEAARSARKPVGIRWDNPWGVALCGVLRAGEVLHDDELIQFACKHNEAAANYWQWLVGLEASVTNADKAELRSFESSTALWQMMRFNQDGIMDYCGTMGIEMLACVRRCAGGKESRPQQALLQAIGNYIVNQQPRLPDGTFWRPMLRGTVWSDDLFKGCGFLVLWSNFNGDPKYIDEAAKQVINMSALLQDKDGLWYHGYFEREHRTNGAKWGRANGWVLMGTVDLLSAMPTNHPSRAAILNVLRRQIEGLKKVQAPSGAWHQLLDHPELWEETSCTAMFAYGIARAAKEGWTDASNMDVARKAFSAVCRKLTPEGAITDVCEGTGIFWDYDYYANRRRPLDEMHGRGAVLLAGAEILSAAK